jgi:hypothetical protein
MECEPIDGVTDWGIGRVSRPGRRVAVTRFVQVFTGGVIVELCCFTVSRRVVGAWWLDSRSAGVDYHSAASA